MSNRPHLSKIKKAVKKTHSIVEPAEIARAWQEAGMGKLKLMFADPDFMALPMDVWQDFIEWSKVDQLKYKVSRFDCENFSLTFSSQAASRISCNGAGIVFDISGGHAYTALLVKEQGEDLRIVLLEPQTDGTVKTGQTMSSTEAYKAEEGFTWFL